MTSSRPFYRDHRLLIGIGVLLFVGFMATTLSSYWVSREAIRKAIVNQELPLAASNIYAEIQKDLVRPVLVSSTMANDTFLRDWMLDGERDVPAISRYLEEVKARYGAFSSFLVSDRTATYYTGSGAFKKISPDEPRDAWYYRVRDMKTPYEINVDPDMANKDAMTIFINYRVEDFKGNYLGATGVGLTIDAVHRLMRDYQARYQRTLYFVDAKGHIALMDNKADTAPRALDQQDRPDLARQLGSILAEQNGGYDYMHEGRHYLLNVHYIPELHWYLFVEKDESEALAGVRHALYANLLGCLVVMVVVLLLAHMSVKKYQSKMESLATTDDLTGLLNRRAFSIVMERHMASYQRTPQAFCILLIDIDHFKSINDRYGHDVGDQVLKRVGELLRHKLRRSDVAVRWGGEEFLVLLQGCDLVEAGQIAEKLRHGLEVERIFTEKHTIQITLSIGVSKYRDRESPDHCIQRADAALYEAKNNGRNRVRTAELPASMT
jgi:diguanylate cyclase (GGDEF)-like protein